jgi:exodeoxyribonuclease VII large subunit
MLGVTMRRWPAPENLLAPQLQKLDDLGDRLPRGLGARLDRARGELGRSAGALRPGLLVAIQRRATERLAALWRVAELVHPNKPLERGYARVEDGKGHTLTSAAAARAAVRLRLFFGDGDVGASVDGAAPVRRPSPPRAAGEQPKLL